jgi:hypothetical protein
MLNETLKQELTDANTLVRLVLSMVGGVVAALPTDRYHSNLAPEMFRRTRVSLEEAQVELDGLIEFMGNREELARTPIAHDKGGKAILTGDIVIMDLGAGAQYDEFMEETGGLYPPDVDPPTVQVECEVLGVEMYQRTGFDPVSMLKVIMFHDDEEPNECIVIHPSEVTLAVCLATDYDGKPIYMGSTVTVHQSPIDYDQEAEDGKAAVPTQPGEFKVIGYNDKLGVRHLDLSVGDGIHGFSAPGYQLVVKRG